MANGEKSEQRIGPLVKDVDFILTKLEVVKLAPEGDFDPKNIRGDYVVNTVNKIDSKQIKADMRLHLFHGAGEKKFFDLECEYTVSVNLTQELTREVQSSGNDAIDLFDCCIPYIDSTIGPILKTMGYTVKLGK